MGSAARRQKAKSKQKPVARQKVSSVAWAWVGLCVTILFVVIVRVPRLDVPIERDEGEYAYAGQLLLDGVVPYKLAYNMKLPGMYAAFAVIMAVFGQTSVGIHLGLMVVNIAAILLVFLLCKRVFGAGVGLVASSTYALMSLGLGVLGWTAHATHFVILAALGGLWFLFEALELGRWWQVFLSGLLFGVAFVFKQPGILFGAFAGVVLLADEWRKHPGDWMNCLRKGSLMSAGAILPFALTCLVLWWAGVFEKFWFWTVSYSSVYSATLESGMRMLRVYFRDFAGRERYLWGMAGLGLVSLLLPGLTLTRKLGVLGFVLVSAVAVCLGFHFRAHYFVLSLPAVGLLAGLAVSAAGRLLKGWSVPRASLITGAALVGLYGYVIAGQRHYLFPSPPARNNLLFFGGNPCREVVAVADHIRTNSTPESRIAVMGSEPAIYFYAQRRSATGYIYTYGLTGQHQYALRMQQEMMREVETAKPEFFVWVNDERSWLATTVSDETILRWFNQYVETYYDVVGIVDRRPAGTVYRWGAEAKGYRAESDSIMVVFSRKKVLPEGTGKSAPGTDARQQTNPPASTPVPIAR